MITGPIRIYPDDFKKVEKAMKRFKLKTLAKTLQRIIKEWEDGKK